MKAKIKYSHATKHEQDSKIMQLSDFPELSDQELELLIGGGGLAVVSSSTLKNKKWGSNTGGSGTSSSATS